MNAKPTPGRIAELRVKVDGVMNLKYGCGVSLADLADILAILDKAEGMAELVELMQPALLILDSTSFIDTGNIKGRLRAALAKLEGTK